MISERKAKVDKEHGENLYRIYIYEEDTSWGYSQKFYHKPELTRFRDTMAALTTTEERSLFIQKERDFTVQVEKHAKLQRKWSESRPSRSDEIEATRERMITFIKARLKLHDWEDELQHMNKWQLLQIPCLKQAREITDRIWTNIEPAVLKYMEEHKAARLERARQALLTLRFRFMEHIITPYLLALSKTTMVPHIIDICLMDETRLIVDVPETTALTAADFRPLISLLPTLAQRWRTNIESQYIQHISSNERTTASGSVFELFTSCRRCCNILFFPDSLTHECHNLPRGRRKEDEPKFKKTRSWQETQEYLEERDLIRRLPVYERATRCLSAYVPWSCDHDSFEEESGVVRKIVVACGQLHQNVTCTEMDNLDVRLSCGMCSQKGRMVIVTWRSAIHHALVSHRERISVGGRTGSIVPDLAWTLVSGDHSTKAKEVESCVDFNPKPDDDDDSYWCCSLCKHVFTAPRDHYYQPWKGTKQDVCQHLVIFHRIHHPTRLHFYRDPESIEVVIPPVILLSDDLSVDDLSTSENEALQSGHASFFSLPA